MTNINQDRLVALEIGSIDAALADTTPVTLSIEPGPYAVSDGWVVLAAHAITGLIVCRACRGSLEVEGEPCPRCQWGGVPTGVDPEAREGCVGGEEHTST